jgi:hypothetical protein
MNHAELVQRLLKIVHERVPFAAGDFHVLVRLVHGTPRVFLRAAGGPADHFRDQAFESRRGHAMVRFIDPGIRVQSRSTMMRSMKSSTTLAIG